MIRRLAALALVALPLLARAAPAHAEDPWFENGVVHFQVPDLVLVDSTRVRAPEGPVDVITVRPSQTLMGGVTGPSFVSLTIFHEPLPGEGEQTDLALDVIVDGVRAAMAGADVRIADRDITLVGEDVDGVRLSIDLGGASAFATAGAVAHDDRVLVYYDQRHAQDGPIFDALNTVARTLGFGDAPEADGTDAAAEAEDHGGEDRGDDEHHEDHE